MAGWQTCTRKRACSPISGKSGYGRVAVAADMVPATWCQQHGAYGRSVAMILTIAFNSARVARGVEDFKDGEWVAQLAQLHS
jgi:hypothetical protein